MIKKLTAKCIIGCSLILLSIGTFHLTTAFAESCEVGNEDIGDWNPICAGTGCGCGQDWGGAQVTINEVILSTSNNTTVEALKDNMKIVELLGCRNWYDATSCGTPGQDGGSCCAYYMANRPDNPTWPPCVDEGADFMNEQSGTVCNPSVCAASTGGCVTCDSEGGVHQRSGIYAWDDPHIKVLTNRTLFQWVCDSCRNPTDHYQNKLAECGSAQNILNWDNETCTGECKPPCDDELNAKAVECKGKDNIDIINWNYDTCEGDCLTEENYGPPGDPNC